MRVLLVIRKRRFKRQANRAVGNREASSVQGTAIWEPLNKARLPNRRD